jgi:CcmD family protein
MFLSEGPADTINYFIAGYVVIFTVMFGYLASLILRNRNLKQDLEVLEELEKKDQ